MCDYKKEILNGYLEAAALSEQICSDYSSEDGNGVDQEDANRLAKMVLELKSMIFEICC